MNKKGAMELSVTAIVVLIIAIVMLGLALGFVRGMFGKVSTQFEEQISAEPDPPAPHGSEPVTLSRESLIMRAKESGVLKVGVFNPTNEDWVISAAWPCDKFTTPAECGALVAGTDGQIGCAWDSANDLCCDIASVADCSAGTATVVATACGAAGVDVEATCIQQVGCMWDHGTSACVNSNGVVPYLSCNGLGFSGLSSNPKPILQGGTEEFNVLFDVVASQSAGTFLCQVRAATLRKDFTIKIRK